MWNPLKRKNKSMNKTFLLLLFIMLILSCTNKESEKEIDTIETTEFFGKESVCIDLKNKSCGYKISILTTPNAFIHSEVK